MQPHPRICTICHKPIPAGDTYACGISLLGWPHQVPQTLYCCRSTCKPAALAEAQRHADTVERQRSPAPKPTPRQLALA